MAASALPDRPPGAAAPRPRGGERQYVFAYGSLVAEAAAGGLRARLRGHRRRWGVAMDNEVDLPGYKAYLTSDGRRPELLVAFLDLVRDRRAHADGLLLEVDGERLAWLDARERNYERVDVTAAVEPAPGTVWAYRGTRGARARLRRARRRGRAVIQRAYLDGVRAAFARAGIADDLDPGDLRVAELERFELAPPAAATASAPPPAPPGPAG